MTPGKRPHRSYRATGNLLRILREQGTLPSDLSEWSEPESHGDESWLVSYADLMTLLFGLFVMLYSISSIDTSKWKKIQESTQKEFGQKEIGPSPPPVLPLPAAQGKTDELVQLEKTVGQLERELREQHGVPEPAAVASVDPRREERALLTIADLEKEAAQLRTERDFAQKRIQSLEGRLAATTTPTTASFIAFVMAWPTPGQAGQGVTLTVQDPSGKVFDLRNRKYPNHPGAIVLESPTGPGAEIWQAEKVLPGTYRFTYSAGLGAGPVSVSGTLFSAKGSFEFPPAKLDAARQSQMTFEVQIDAQGNVVR